MSDNDTTTPNAEQPTTVAADLHGSHGLHADGESHFGASGVEFEVKVWTDGDADASLVADVCERLTDAGYDIRDVTTVEANGNVRVRGEVSTDG